jgi:hypothetical protein
MGSLVMHRRPIGVASGFQFLLAAEQFSPRRQDRDPFLTLGKSSSFFLLYMVRHIREDLDLASNSSSAAPCFYRSILDARVLDFGSSSISCSLSHRALR